MALPNPASVVKAWFRNYLRPIPPAPPRSITAEYLVSGIEQMIDLLSINTWTPTLGVVTDGTRRVMQVVDWVGGIGPKPDTGAFLTQNGYTLDISQATDVRGLPGPITTSPVVSERLNSLEGSRMASTGADASQPFVITMPGADGVERIVVSIGPDGALTAKLAGGLVGPSQLTTELAAMLGNNIDTALTGIFRAYVDANDRMPWFITDEGWNEIPKLRPYRVDWSKSTGKNIPFAELADSARREGIVPADRVVTIPSAQGFRSDQVQIAAGLDFNGAIFAPFPHHASTMVKVLAQGDSFQVRRSSGLTIRGKRQRGTFDPTNAGGVIGLNFRGFYGSSASAFFPTPIIATPVAGDYVIADGAANGGTVTQNGLTFKRGDALVWNGSAYVVQPAPVPSDATYPIREGDYWNVTVSGTFDGVNYAAGDRMVMVSNRQSGGPQHYRYLKAKPGQYCYCGELTAATAGAVLNTATPLSGDLYQYVESGTFAGVAGVVDDYLVYEFGQWMLVANAVSTTIPNSKYATFAGLTNADQLEIRRASKANPAAGQLPYSVSAWVQRQTARMRSGTDLTVYGDSMAAGFGPRLAQQLPARSVTTNGYGGARAREILNDMLYLIERGDTDGGKTLLIWTGYNNTYDLGQTYDCVLKMVAAQGARDVRVVVMSMPGKRGMIWDGTRIVVPDQEDAFNALPGSYVRQYEQWLQVAFGGRWLNTRLAFLASAVGNTTPDLLQPGKTVAQSASLYGHIPLTYSLSLSAYGLTEAQLTYQGTRAVAGLPTGGAATNYYIRTGGGTVGNLCLNVNGVWQEVTWDLTHYLNAGYDVLASELSNLLTLINY